MKRTREGVVLMSSFAMKWRSVGHSGVGLAVRVSLSWRDRLKEV